MSIQGLSEKKALEIVRCMQSEDSNNFLKTPQSQRIYQDIIDKILAYTNTTYANNRVKLMQPTTDYDQVQKTQELITKTLEDTKDLDYDYIRKLYTKIEALHDDVRPKFNDEYAIVCEDYDDYLKLIEKHMDRYCNIYALEDTSLLTQYEFIVYVYNNYNVDLGEVNNIITISNDSGDEEIQPNIILNYYKSNRDILENVYQLREYLGLDSCIPEIISTLDEINKEEAVVTDLTENVEEIKDEANEEIKEAIKNVELDGEEVLQLLNNEDLPPKLTTIFNEVLEKSRAKINEKTGLLLDPFIVKYPIEPDYDEINRVQENEISNIHLREFEQEQTASTILSQYKDKVIAETMEVIHYDYQFSLANFMKVYELTMPEIGDEYVLEGSIHLALKQQEIEDGLELQEINYNLNNEENIVLLTGANSGGKTTLLETLGQHCIMAHMGLGVCSKRAVIPETREVYYFTKRQSLNAGAFETFLTSFIPVAVGEKNKLILIDELESITELEAAIKIIIGFIEHIQDDESYAVIVTHMAPEILKHTSNINIRTDGIEAKGLDENYNLIVDRSPRINYLANSTPELILRKIYEKSDEPLKSVYKDILDKFD